MILERHPNNPILLPDPTSDWECFNVFNPSVIYHNDLFHMHYRAQGLDWVSRIGYAVSQDGVHWNRMRRPVLEPADATESRGVEDPRVVEVDGTFYMTYTGYGSGFQGQGEPPFAGGGITPLIARSLNLISWERIGPMVRGENNKDHVLFPRRIGDRYAALHRRHPSVWLAYSGNLVTWHEVDMVAIFGPRSDNGWDSLKVGANGPPIETKYGWMLLYHAVDIDMVYRFGVCLLDLEEPSRVIRRPRESIFWPEELWELRGDVPKVVFSCTNPVVDSKVYLYYGGGDHVIGLATCSFSKLIDFVLNAE